MLPHESVNTQFPLPQCWSGEYELRFEKLKCVLTSVRGFTLGAFLEWTPLGWRNNFSFWIEDILRCLSSPAGCSCCGWIVGGWGIIESMSPIRIKKVKVWVWASLPNISHYGQYTLSQIMIPHYTKYSLNLCKPIISYKISLWPLLYRPETQNQYPALGLQPFINKSFNQ